MNPYFLASILYVVLVLGYLIIDAWRRYRRRRREREKLRRFFEEQ